jgi:recombination DNA repair RAD52 pathway protein
MKVVHLTHRLHRNGVRIDRSELSDDERRAMREVLDSMKLGREYVQRKIGPGLVLEVWYIEEGKA